ncbi:SnoaL-like domain-containing protein [uncultured Draconibacterium sp.]|uniref:SnoaL-like domain-containing protein n=1 Tax=uncultured Draconibacterium sp. TaxID=1573823 RepID=UPI003217696C
MQKIDPKKLTLTERVEKMNQLILHGHILEAFEKFYAETITKQVNNKELTIGKEACRLSEECFVTSISEFRNASVKNVIISDNISVVEWELDFTHNKMGDKKYTQVVVQRWNKDGEIINESIYNNN